MTLQPHIQSWLDELRARPDRPEPLRCIALVSGGLDSMLAVRLMQDQGVEVIPVNFNTRCSNAEFDHRVERHEAGQPLDDPTDIPRSAVIKEAEQNLGVPIRVLPVGDDYLHLLTKPEFGYGQAANPCVDCRIHLFGQALQLLPEYEAHFIVTGEVIGQRPKSQNKRAINIVTDRSSGAGFILRPLSAKVMPITVPEEKGWIDREGLLDLYGRGRKKQLEMAEQHGLVEVPQPAGGCAYVESGFASRFFDFLAHNDDDALDFADITLLRVGRHFRIDDRAKLIVGRDAGQNRVLETWTGTHVAMKAATIKTPFALLDLRRDLAVAGLADESSPLSRDLHDTIRFAASIVARYADCGPDDEVAIELMVPQPDGGQAVRLIGVTPATDAEIEPLSLVHTPPRSSVRGSRRKFRRDDAPAATLAAIDHRAERQRAHPPSDGVH